MNFNPDIHQRQTIRLKGYDYSHPGAYFMTICTWNKECLFGEIVEGEMRINEFGEVVRACWDEIPRHFRDVELDTVVIMPNHVHGVLVFTNQMNVGATHASPVRNELPKGPKPGSLGAVVGSFKSAATNRINVLRPDRGIPVWHRNYYEHVIRDEGEWNRIREYIVGNPLKWLEDEENPDNFN